MSILAWSYKKVDYQVKWNTAVCPEHFVCVMVMDFQGDLFVVLMVDCQNPAYRKFQVQFVAPPTWDRKI